MCVCIVSQCVCLFVYVCLCVCVLLFSLGLDRHNSLLKLMMPPRPRCWRAAAAQCACVCVCVYVCVSWPPLSDLWISRSVLIKLHIISTEEETQLHRPVTEVRNQSITVQWSNMIIKHSRWCCSIGGSPPYIDNEGLNIRADHSRQNLEDVLVCRWFWLIMHGSDWLQLRGDNNRHSLVSASS